MVETRGVVKVRLSFQGRGIFILMFCTHSKGELPEFYYCYVSISVQ